MQERTATIGRPSGFTLVELLLVIAVLLVLAVVLFPVYAPRPFGDRAAYQQVLYLHQPSQAPRPKGQLPFLYVSWFPNGSPRHAEEFAAYGDGSVVRRRVLWDYAIQGGRGPALNVAAFRSLKRVPVLPAGLPGPDAVPCRRMLIVSQFLGGRWSTGYYDRSRLPGPVQAALQLMQAAGYPGPGPVAV